MKLFITILVFLLTISQLALASTGEPRIIAFSSGELSLRGELFLPEGKGPFPTVLYNHGSAPKMLNSQTSAVIAPMFTKMGWAFFMPYRRGQGLSEDKGPYIMHEIRAAKWSLFGSASETMVNLLKTDHLNDQMAALAWLKRQDFVQKTRIATMGNSFGGIQVVLGMARGTYCAGVDAAGGAESWKNSLELRQLMISTIKALQRPVFFFQATNDYDLSPSKILSSEMTKVGKMHRLKIYPHFGDSAKEGHSFPYKGVSIWFNDVFSFLNIHCPVSIDAS
ncbi:alpha/beta hydrolase family protein [Sulfuriflexus mobilis]|uniref:alpha/beta hydrolase family protein n=1 Tax=Sulfuriflexus mobilis TaxID=1811807 RepID=UPI000F82918E|nr:prolyl oligopeptidase family serine peptidase [Sulfuriflexus mobilis]